MKNNLHNPVFRYILIHIKIRKGAFYDCFTDKKHQKYYEYPACF